MLRARRLRKNLGRDMKLTIILTGGTIAKTYDASTGDMINVDNDPARLFDGICLDAMDLRFADILQKDSLDFTEEDFQLILDTVRDSHNASEKAVILCGTDRLPDLAARLAAEGFGDTGTTVITGAMVPLSVKGSDGAQNITQALMVARLKDKGVYTAFHNQVFEGADVRKDRDALTMVSA